MRVTFSAPYGDGWVSKYECSNRVVTNWRDIAGRRTAQQFIEVLYPNVLTTDELAECIGIWCRDHNVHHEDTNYMRLAQALLSDYADEVGE